MWYDYNITILHKIFLIYYDITLKNRFFMKEIFVPFLARSLSDVYVNFFIVICCDYIRIIKNILSNHLMYFLQY